MTRGDTWRSWAALAAGLATVGTYFLLPRDGIEQAVLYGVVGLAAAAALAVGPSRLGGASARLPWLLLGGGIVCFAVGDALFYVYAQSAEQPFPSAADGAYLAAYPLLFAGVLLLGRERGRRLRFTLLDAFVTAGAFALVQWVFVMEPLAREDGGLARVTLLAYPAMDVLLVAALARLLFTPAWRCAALWLLAGAIFLQLLGDQIYLSVAETYTGGSLLDATWLLSYVLFAAAALHPSLARLGQPARGGPALGWARVLLLGSALVGVAIGLAASAADGLELAVLATLGVAVSVLVLLRIVDLVRLLATENERLREVDRLKDEFVGLVSHDLRTPLTSIAGYAELLLDDGDGLRDDQRRFVTVIDRNARRLQRLLDDLLFEARLQAGGATIEPEELDLAELARNCVEESGPAAAEGGVEVELDAVGAVPLVADRARLAQVLDNLVSNAIKFTPAGGRVTLSVRRAGPGAVVEVADTGIGIPAGEEDQLFTRFYRASNAHTRQLPGTGLGLHIAHAIVEAHGGTIAALRRPEAGTTVRVELPLSPPAAGNGSRSP